MRGPGDRPRQQELELERGGPPVEARQRLERPADPGEVLFIERLRLGDGVPMGLMTSYHVLPDGLTLDREGLEAAGSMYTLLQERFHLIPTEADETLEGGVGTPREGGLLQ